MNTHGIIAYFSMEIALDPGMPTYSGGLGVLAGDTLRAAADLKVPLVAVSLLHRLQGGHSFQHVVWGEETNRDTMVDHGQTLSTGLDEQLGGLD